MRAKALAGRTIIRHGLGDYDQAIAFAGEARALAAEAGDQELELRALGNLGAMYIEQEDSELATRYLTETIELAERLGDEVEVARGNYNLASVMLLNEKHVEALGRFETTLEICRRQGNKPGEILSLTKLGYTLYKLGEPLQSCRRQAESLQLATESGRAYFATEGLRGAGGDRLRSSRVPRARRGVLRHARLAPLRTRLDPLRARHQKEIEPAPGCDRRHAPPTGRGGEQSLERCCEAAWGLVECDSRLQ